MTSYTSRPHLVGRGWGGRWGGGESKKGLSLSLCTSPVDPLGKSLLLAGLDRVGGPLGRGVGRPAHGGHALSRGDHLLEGVADVPLGLLADVEVAELLHVQPAVGVARVVLAHQLAHLKAGQVEPHGLEGHVQLLDADVAIVVIVYLWTQEINQSTNVLFVRLFTPR